MALPVLDTLQLYFDYRSRTGAGFEQPILTVAASQTIQRGDFLVWTSGAQTVEQALALPGSNNNVTTSGGSLLLVGVAMAPIVTASNGIETATGRTTIPVLPLDYVQIAMNIYNSTPGDAEPTDLTVGPAQSYRLGRYRGASASIWGYVLTTTTTGELIYDEPVQGVSLTTDYGPAWVRVKDASKGY
jgi:hypothetical protein